MFLTGQLTRELSKPHHPVPQIDLKSLGKEREQGREVFNIENTEVFNTETTKILKSVFF